MEFSNSSDVLCPRRAHNEAMFQAMKELRAAPGRTALITITVGMIAVMVTFLSALAAGLANQSASAIDELFGDDDAVIVSDSSSSLAASALPTATTNRVQSWASQNQAQVRPLRLARARVGDAPVSVLSDPSLKGDSIVIVNGVAGKAKSDEAPREIPKKGATLTLEGTTGNVSAKVTGNLGDKWLDHQAIVLASDDTVTALSGGNVTPPAALVVSGAASAPDVMPEFPDTKVLRGDDLYSLSAAYTGQNTSLKTMIGMLYAISALVVGAFFTVWTVQRLRGVAITSALGASRSVLIGDSLAQVVTVLVAGVGLGTAITAVSAWALSSNGILPVVISPATMLPPGLIIIATGIIGALLALIPVFRVDPTTALANT